MRQASYGGSETASATTITVGCFASLCRDRLGDRLVAFSTAFPDVAIGVHEMGDAELLPAVAAGTLALAIRPGGFVKGFDGCDLWGERAVVAMARGHRLIAAPTIVAATLQNEVLLVSRDRARAALHRLLSDRLFDGDPPATRIVADARRCHMLDRIAEGEGIALMCESQIDAAMTHLAVRPIADESARFRVRAYWLEGPQNEPLATMINLLTEGREA